MSGDSGRLAKMLDGSTGDTTPLTNNDGTTADWKSILMASLGAISMATFSSFADLIATFFQSWIIDPLQEYSAAAETTVELLVQSPERSVDVAFTQTEQFIDGLGIFAFVGAIAFVLVMAFLVAEVRARL